MLLKDGKEGQRASRDSISLTPSRLKLVETRFCTLFVNHHSIGQPRENFSDYLNEASKYFSSGGKFCRLNKGGAMRPRRNQTTKIKI
jgi:hypothetical protein